MNTKINCSSLAHEIMRKSRYVLCNFSGKIMQLETFCLTQTCYDVHELLFKGEDEGLPQMDCGVDSCGLLRDVLYKSHWGCGFRSNADC